MIVILLPNGGSIAGSCGAGADRCLGAMPWNNSWNTRRSEFLGICIPNNQPSILIESYRPIYIYTHIFA